MIRCHSRASCLRHHSITLSARSSSDGEIVTPQGFGSLGELLNGKVGGLRASFSRQPGIPVRALKFGAGIFFRSRPGGLKLARQSTGDALPVGDDREGATVAPVDEPVLGGYLEQVSVDGIQHDLREHRGLRPAARGPPARSVRDQRRGSRDRWAAPSARAAPESPCACWDQTHPPPAWSAASPSDS